MKSDDSKQRFDYNKYLKSAETSGATADYVQHDMGKKGGFAKKKSSHIRISSNNQRKK